MGSPILPTPVVNLVNPTTQTPVNQQQGNSAPLTDNPNAVVSEGFGADSGSRPTAYLGQQGQAPKVFGAYKVENGKVVANGDVNSMIDNSTGASGSMATGMMRFMANRYKKGLDNSGGQGATLVPGPGGSTSSIRNFKIVGNGDDSESTGGNFGKRIRKSSGIVGRSLIGNSTAGGNAQTGGNSMLGG